MSEGVEKKQDNEIDETNELNNLLTNDKPSNVKEAEKNNDRKKNKEEVINNENEKDNIKNNGINKGNLNSKKEKLENSNSKEKINSEEKSLENTSSVTSLSSLTSSLDSLNIENLGVVVPTEIIKEEMNSSSNAVNLTSSNTTKAKAKATSSTILETASSSVIVNSKNNATTSILHIKNSASSHSLNTGTVKSHTKKSHEKKKSKGKNKAKTEEEQEIDDIRNSINFSDVDLADEFMGLASSSVVNKNKDKHKNNMNNTDENENYNSNAEEEEETENKSKKKGKNKSKESKTETNIPKANNKGASAIVEGPYTVFHSSSSSSSLDFLLESAAVASSSRNNNNEPPLNINFNHRLPNSQLNNISNISDNENQEDGNDNNGIIDISRLASSSSSSLLGLRYSQKNLDDILLKPVPIDQNIKCTLIRSKMKNVPSYELYIENTDSTFSPLLYSRKVRIGNHSEYVITKKIFTTSVPEESEIIGRLKSNFVGTAFVLYDNNKKQVKKENLDELRSELGAVLYEPNILGFKGPRKMKIITTRLNEQGEFIPCKPRHAKDTLIERSKDPFDREMLVLYNKAPQWNEETQSYVLNFNHRVRIASVKNFQIINNDDCKLMFFFFFFILDFRYPFSALLAFAIALTSLDTKIAFIILFIKHQY